MLAGTKEVSYDEVSQEVFLDTYSKDIYPLVSIIIPTFERPHYFRLALESVLAQTYRNLDIFITDNSHNTETAELMRRDFSDDPRIQYEHHPSYGAYQNWARARSYNNPDAAYVNWLMDDDLFMPDKISIMMDAFFANSDITLVTSYRECIDENGNKLPDSPTTRSLAQEVTKFSGETIGTNMLVHMNCFVGEPTTVLLKKEFLLKGYDMGFSGKEGKYLISDFPMWLRLLSQGNMVYFPMPLSKFRIHAGNDQRSMTSRIRAIICWALSMREAIECNIYLRDLSTQRKAILKWLSFTVNTLSMVETIPEFWEDTEFQDMLRVFVGMSNAICSDCRIDFDIDTTLVLQMISEEGKVVEVSY